MNASAPGNVFLCDASLTFKALFSYGKYGLRIFCEFLEVGVIGDAVGYKTRLPVEPNQGNSEHGETAEN